MYNYHNVNDVTKPMSYIFFLHNTTIYDTYISICNLYTMYSVLRIYIFYKSIYFVPYKDI